MKFTRLILIIFVLGLSSNSNANGITYLGSASCGDWIQNRTGGGDAKLLLNTAQEFWLLGYLSGVANGLGVDFMRTSDAASFYLWMDNYCRDNPLDNVADGAVKLARELKKKMH